MRLFLYRTAKKFVDASDPDKSSPLRVAIILAFRKWIHWDLRRLDAKRQRILKKGAAQGKKLTLEQVLELVDQVKTNYLIASANPELNITHDDFKSFSDELNAMKKKLRDKFPNGIPLDEAWQLTKVEEWNKYLDK